MVIAVDASFMAKEGLNDYEEFRKELLIQMISKFPQHQFYLISDRPFSILFTQSNVHSVVLKPGATNPLLWKFWLDIKLPALLKKLKADVFIGLNGQLSTRSKIPQYLVVDEESFNRPEALSKSHAFFYKRYIPKFLRKANALLVLSEATKTKLLREFHLSDETINVLYPAVNDVHIRVEWQEKEAIKEQYTEDKEYFLHQSFNTSAEQLVKLLKAFSFFKKRQQSGMKLVLAGTFSDEKKADELLSTFKYRNDIVRVNKEEERLIAAAYAVIQINEGFETLFLKAMKSAVPVLLSQKSLMKEYAGDAALYFDGSSIAEIAEMMMFIYKDEAIRGQLIQKGKELSAAYSWDNTIEVFWQKISKAMEVE